MNNNSIKHVKNHRDNFHKLKLISHTRAIKIHDVIFSRRINNKNILALKCSPQAQRFLWNLLQIFNTLRNSHEIVKSFCGFSRRTPTRGAV
jgi:hypothetical protein